ncbi:MAG: hypothetical protein HJJLKODD_01220 [Phycisphaerae bacterium]|nr:hypothetical protein [Phycisphaerae bacterium]
MNPLRQYIETELHRRASEQGQSLPPLTDEFNWLEAGVMDSYSFLDLLARIEQQFSVEADLSEADPAELVTLGGLTKILSPA